MKNEKYISISKAFSSSHLGKVGASTTFNSFVPINKIAELKGLTSNRSLRLAIQKGKYIARVVKVFGGKSYEILYSSLEPEIQRILRGVAECVSQSEQMANDEFWSQLLIGDIGYRAHRCEIPAGASERLLRASPLRVASPQ